MKQTHSKLQLLPRLITPNKQTKKIKSFDYWLNKNKYYHYRLKKFYQFSIPFGARVLQVGCHNGHLLDAVKPSYGIGIDYEQQAIESARQRYPTYQFFVGGVEQLIPETFDYIILSCVTMQINDIQDFFTALQSFCHPSTRIIVDSYSYLWEPILWLTQKLGLRRPTIFKNWVSHYDLINFLYCADFQVITKGRFTLLPIYIPFVSTIMNIGFAQLPLLNRLCLNEWIIARPFNKVQHDRNVTVSIVIPCKNEKGNIETAVQQCPEMGIHTELIFIDGNSQDGTYQEMQRIVQRYAHKMIRIYKQKGMGKGDAVRQGFALARGDILMIQDGDLTAPPQELSKFFEALISGKGEFINGSRLVYGMEAQAMRFLNVLANYFFSMLFSWTLQQKVKDTLCGTKVLWRRDYQKIVANRAFFGEFDPFGDFDLLFGAAKLNLKILDMPVHYKSRRYGTSQIRRFVHGWILLYMSLIALRKFKLY